MLEVVVIDERWFTLGDTLGCVTMNLLELVVLMIRHEQCGLNIATSS